MNDKDYDVLVKTIMVGESGAGKSSLLERFVDETFNTPYICGIGVDFKIKTVQCMGQRVKLQMWDTAGQERFRTITASYYRIATIAFIAFDLTRAEDVLSSCKKWVDEVDAHAPDTCFLALVGCKADLADKRVVSFQDAQQFAGQHGMPYYETSSKTGAGVCEMFHAVVIEQQQRFPAPRSRVARRHAPQGVRLPSSLPQNANEKKGWGC